jgi:hypothetical protein
MDDPAPDRDGDGLANDSDPDVDGDGIANGDDPEVDGDGVPNDADTDIDGDGITNGTDEDVDGDGLAGDDDPDIDGDGVANGTDPDIDADGLNNDTDPEPSGPVADDSDDDAPGAGDADDDGTGGAAGQGDGSCADEHGDDRTNSAPPATKVRPTPPPAPRPAMPKAATLAADPSSSVSAPAPTGEGMAVGDSASAPPRALSPPVAPAGADRAGSPAVTTSTLAPPQHFRTGPYDSDDSASESEELAVRSDRLAYDGRRPNRLLALLLGAGVVGGPAAVSYAVWARLQRNRGPAR